jgi:formylglycine-generating enzyme required for sulfatase activity
VRNIIGIRGLWFGMRAGSVSSSVALLLFAALLWPRPARAQVDPNSGIDFVTIGAVGNAPWMGDGTPGDNAIGRGRVDYEYAIGRTEVPLSLWVEFYNAAYDRPAGDSIPHVALPFWGAASTTPNNPGGRRWSVPAGRENFPVGGIDWRTAAILCNWLHNNKSTSREAFLNGAYDVSTFGYGPPGDIFTDQDAHHPNARYYIPTWDEWLKAAHFDPNRNDPNLGGWWRYSYMSDEQRAGGLPPSMGGVGNGNYGFPFGSTDNPFIIPLGAYPNVQSPWGLLDTAGGTKEWTESIQSFPNGQRFRYSRGSYWSSSPGTAASDSIYAVGSFLPNEGPFSNGLRISMSIPIPSTALVLGTLVAFHSRRRRIHGGSLCVGKFSVSSRRSSV